jgi:hypothetical protein
MDWQLLLVVGSVILALLYLGRQTLRSWSGKGAGCSGCKYPSTSQTPNTVAAQTWIPIDQVRLRR